MLEAGFDTRAAVNAMTGCARALGMADLSVTAVGRTMMASHVSERGVPIMMTQAAATIDSFDLHRMGRIHQVLAEMLREDVDVKRASESILRLGASGIGGIAGGSAECLRNRDDIGLCGNHRHGTGAPASDSSDRPSRSVKSEE